MLVLPPLPPPAIMRKPLTAVLAIILVVIFLKDTRLSAFNDLGHHVVAVLAYDLIPTSKRNELLRILQQHPRFETDFIVPESIQGNTRATARWHAGVAGYWPDIIRPFDEWTRPTWHYQLGASLVLGPVHTVQVPEMPGPLPDDATLETRELYIVQAIALCRHVLADQSRPDADRAVAICWIAHLVADAHQPCHAGSLYAQTVFPEGDRGANHIVVEREEGPTNLHAVWDNLLGRLDEPQRVDDEIGQLRRDPMLMLAGATSTRNACALDPLVWLSESRLTATRHVYTDETLAPVHAVMRGLTDEVYPVKLSDQYMQTGRSVVRLRLVQAAHRLALIYYRDL